MANFILFFFMFVIIYFYSYVIGGETSMLMLYMFFVSPIVSLLLTWPLKNKIDINIQISQSEVEKEGILTAKVHIKNRTILPIPFVIINFIKAPNFANPSFSQIKVALGPLKERTVTAQYVAVTRGISEVGVENIFLRDYLGFFNFSMLKCLEAYQYKGQVSVLPRIINLKPNSKILISSMNSGAGYEDSAQSSISSFSFTGEPGYEFREYMPGDPLHKIHWKLSAKTETLMVRKDEARSLPKKRIIVDPYLATDIEGNKKAIKRSSGKKASFEEIEMENRIIEDRILESLLAVANITIKASRNIELWLLENGTWVEYTINEPVDVNKLQHKLTNYTFINTIDSLKRIPISHVLGSMGNRRATGGEVMIFTGCYDKDLAPFLNEFLYYKINVEMVVVKKPEENTNLKEEQYLDNKGGTMWILTTEDDMVEAFS